MIYNLFRRIKFHFLYETKLKRKLIFTYFIIISIPVFVLGIFLTQNLYDTTFSNKIESSNTTVRQISENISAGLLRQTSVIKSLISDIGFMNYLNTYYIDDYESLSDYQNKIKPIMAKLSNDGQDFIIKIFSKNRTIGFSSEMNQHVDELKNKEWYKAPDYMSEVVFWTGLSKLNKTDENNYIGCYRTLYDFTNARNVLAIISISMNENRIYSLISEEKAGGNIVFLLNSDGTILSTTERDLLGHSSVEIMDKGLNILTLKSGTIVKYKGRSYLYSIMDINKENAFIKDWKTVYMTPADRILHEIKFIWINSIVLSILCIMASLIIISSVSANINNRITNLVCHMKMAFNGDLKEIPQVEGRDEISILQNDFNTMVKKLEILIHEVYESKIKIQGDEIVRNKIELKRKHAEIKAFQRQINPHYLINTLESIRMNLVLKKDFETAEVIKKLAGTFRVLVYENKSKYTIREEIDFIRMYMDIQQYRFGNRIRINYYVPSEFLGIYIPKLIIQPLVENAVCHGIGRKDEGGTIQIKVYCEDYKLIIMVSDDGVGMSPVDLSNINNKLENYANEDISEDTTESVALLNIHQRIKLGYGNTYGLKVFSEKGKGTKVYVLLPMIDESI